MATFKSSSSPWKVGVGQFRFHNDDVALKMEIWTPEKTIEEKFIFKSKLLPSVPPRGLLVGEQDGGEYYVALKVDDFGMVDSIESIRPNRYSDYLVLPVDMTRDKGSDGEAGEPKAYGPDSYGRMKINVFLEVQEPEEYKGVRIKYNLLDKFCDDGQGNLGFDFSLESLQSSRAVRIQDFFKFWTDLTGVFPAKPLKDKEGNVVNYELTWPMDWPDDGNPYPELLARLLDKKPYLRISGRANEIFDLYAEKNYAPAPDNAPIPDEESAPPSVEDEDDPFAPF